ncbi:unnamed protein product, partial [Phaeothamnion confervicola]
GGGRRAEEERLPRAPRLAKSYGLPRLFGGMRPETWRCSSLASFRRCDLPTSPLLRSSVWIFRPNGLNPGDLSWNIVWNISMVSVPFSMRFTSMTHQRLKGD